MYKMNKPDAFFCICIYTQMQYLHVLKDSKRYMTHPTVQVQSNSQITDIPLSERQEIQRGRFVNVLEAL